MDKDVVIYVHTGEYDLAIKRTNKQKPKLIAKEIKLVVTRGRGWGGREELGGRFPKGTNFQL